MATKELTRVHIRWMIRRDMPEVMQMEAAGFGPAARSEEEFLHVLRQRNCIGMVCEISDGEKLLGFMIYGLKEHSLSILNFAVHPQYRRCGVGRQMTDKLASKLSSHRRQRVDAVVSERNLGAQLFFSSQGYCAVRVLPAFFDGGDDGYLLRHSFAGVEPVADSPCNRIEQFDGR